MTEEELQAFKKLQEIKSDFHSEYWEFGRKTDKEMEKWADTLIQLIKKQQEEIKILNDNLQIADELLAYITDVLGFPEDTIIADEFTLMLNEKYISKDKIREKIKEVDELYDNAETDEFGIKDFYGYDFIMDMLKELLGDEKK